MNRVEDFVIKNENLSVALEPDAESVSYQNDPFGSQHPNDPTSLSTSPLLSKNGLANKYTNKLYPTIRHTFRIMEKRISIQVGKKDLVVHSRIIYIAVALGCRIEMTGFLHVCGVCTNIILSGSWKKE